MTTELNFTTISIDELANIPIHIFRKLKRHPTFLENQRAWGKRMNMVKCRRNYVKSMRKGNAFTGRPFRVFEREAETFELIIADIWNGDRAQALVDLGGFEIVREPQTEKSVEVTNAEKSAEPQTEKSAEVTNADEEEVDSDPDLEEEVDSDPDLEEEEDSDLEEEV